MISASVIRRRLPSRRLDPKEVARLDADALRQRRRRAAKRADERKKALRSARFKALSAATVALAFGMSVLLALGWMRLDLGKAMADTPRETVADASSKTGGDQALLTRLDEIAKGLTRLEGDLARKPGKKIAELPQERPNAPSKTPVASLDGHRLWSAPRGAWSSDVLRRWSEIAGVDLDWQADIDLQLDASIEVSGSFEDAVTNLLEGFAHKTPHPRGQLHLNRRIGRPALVVVAEGNPDG